MLYHCPITGLRFNYADLPYAFVEYDDIDTREKFEETLDKVKKAFITGTIKGVMMNNQKTVDTWRGKFVYRPEYGIPGVPIPVRQIHIDSLGGKPLITFVDGIDHFHPEPIQREHVDPRWYQDALGGRGRVRGPVPIEAIIRHPGVDMQPQNDVRSSDGTFPHFKQFPWNSPYINLDTGRPNPPASDRKPRGIALNKPMHLNMLTRI